MAIIIRKKANEIHPQSAVTFKNELPNTDKPLDVRYVKNEKTFYIYNGIIWQEFDLVIE